MGDGVGSLATTPMMVLIDQQFHLGHHYQYLAHVLPEVVKVCQQVVVGITPAGAKSPEFDAFLAGRFGSVRFEAVLPPADSALPMRQRFRVHRDLRTLVSTYSPDYVLVPSGDAQATAMSAFRAAGIGSLPGRTPCEVGIHFGTGRGRGSTMKSRVRDSLNALSLKMSGLRRIHVMNLLFFEQIRSSREARSRVVLSPHPVVSNPRLAKRESRRVLGVPEDGRYIGLAASIDSRKAIGEFLAAFRSAALPDERLLLAGWINDTHMRTLTRDFGDLIARGQVIVRRGFLSEREFQAVLTALDVVCLPYPGFMGLSSTLLEALAAGRPVLANATGWCHEIVTRFGVGWTCDVLDREDFRSTLRLALDRSAEYRETERIARLLAFHSPENFARTWVQGLHEVSGTTSEPTKSWEWVTEASD